MPEKSKKDEKEPVVLIDFGETVETKKLAEKSAKAIDSAMEAMQAMARRVVEAAEEVPKPPSRVEVSFGLKFDEAGGALVAKASSEAGINVTLTWTRDQKKDEKNLVLGLVPSD